jgi:hypothetical protein
MTATEAELTNDLLALLEQTAYDEGVQQATDLRVRSGGTFFDYGLLTTNKGLVLYLDDGTEVRLTVQVVR